MIDNRILTFLTLCKEMNYRKTAELLNMTQPAVTQHIQYIEREYNCKLFSYENRILKITKIGEKLREHAKNIVYQENKFREELKKRKINLSIAATKTIGEYIILNQVSNYLDNTENNIKIEVNNTEVLLELLDNGKLDFALIEGNFDSSKYAHKIYKKEKFIGICKKGHSFAGKIIELKDIFLEHLILREEGSGTRNIFENFLSENNCSVENFEKITTVANFRLLLDLIKMQNAISFGYESLLHKNKGLSHFYIKDWDLIHEFNYVFLDNPYSSKAVEYFNSYK
ncbi:MAG: LysR family transcriptional regulator [Fusobacterium sp.]|nr:LysR family transcriptional regulator [Fusobacterium sp.]